MEIVRYLQRPGRPITHHQSSGAAIRPVLQTGQEAHAALITLGNNGRLGRHQAASDQLLLIVEGSGWVQTDESQAVAVSAGDGVFWEKGEWHETRTTDGLTALVIESAEFFRR